MSSNFINTNFESSQQNTDGVLENDKKIRLKVAESSEIDPIYIDDSDPNYNWSKTVVENDWCTGGGSINNPYIIKNVTINGNNTGSCVHIRNSIKYFIIRNCAFYNSGSGTNDAGVKLYLVENGKINNCKIVNNNNYGILLYQSKNNVISNNSIKYNDDIQLYLNYECDDNEIFDNFLGFGQSFGLEIHDHSDNNIILHNSFGEHQLDEALRVRELCYNNVIKKNTFNLSRLSIRQESFYTIIESNEFLKTGISLMGASQFSQVFNNNITQGGYGISVDDSFYNNIYNNTLKNNNRGINLFFPGYNTISHNIIIHNDIGLRTMLYASFNNITHNYFKYNDIAIKIGGGQNNLIYYNWMEQSRSWHAEDRDPSLQYWDNGSIGNYWDDYDGVDANDDGIGDTPYNKIYASTAQDNYPIWYDPPDIIINEPNNNEVFGENAPSFNVLITDPNLNTTWYIIDDDTKKYIFSGVSGTINQTSWDEKEDGIITITFYANDTIGNIAFEAINIEKDTLFPVIIINSPPANETFSKSPDFSITIIEKNFESSWYTVEGVIGDFPFSGLTGTIDQDAWDNAPKGEITITFYVQDKAGNIGSKSVVVLKSIPSESVIPGYNLFFLFGIVAIVSILISKKLKYS